MRLAGRIAHIFIQSKLTPLVIIGALLLGVFSIIQTPREEEPQIVVPMLDVFVQMPGASAQEVTERATVPMEKLLRELPGVEYIYSINHPGMSMLIVRFYVGTKEEDAVVQTYNKLYSNFDRIPQGVSQPLIKVRSIDNVPILALTLWGKNYDGYQFAPDRGRARSFAEAGGRRFRNRDHRRPDAKAASNSGHAKTFRVRPHARLNRRAAGCREYAQPVRQLCG